MKDLNGFKQSEVVKSENAALEYLYTVDLQHYKTMTPIEISRKLFSFQERIFKIAEKAQSLQDENLCTSFAMIPNIPLPMVPEVMRIVVDERRWKVERILFMGIGQATKIATPNQEQGIQLYCAICSLRHSRDEKPEFPPIELKG